MIYTNFLTALILKGGEVTSLTCVASRPKNTGCMWDGKATIEYSGMVFCFEMWYAGRYEETFESLLGKGAYELRSILTNGQVIKTGRTDIMATNFDFYWHGWVGNDGSLWLHPIGWFALNKGKDSPQSRVFQDMMSLVGPNGSKDSLNRKVLLTPYKLEAMGFQKIEI